MRSLTVKTVLLLLGGAIVLGTLTLIWGVGTDSSEAQSNSIANCPQAGKWAISVWGGDDATDTGQALAICNASGVDAAYYIDPDTQQWSRWFAGRPEVSNLDTLDNMQGIIALGTLPPTPTPSPTPTLTPTPSPTPGISVDVELSIECFESLSTATSLETAIYLTQQAGLPTTALDVQLAAEDAYIQENCLSVSVVLVGDPSSTSLCADAVAAAAAVAVLIDVAEADDMPHVYLSLQLDQLNSYIQSSCI